MRRSILLTIAISLCGLSFESRACTEPDTPTFRESLDSSESVVIFRLISIELADASQSSRDLTGKIEPVRTLKGSNRFATLRHNAASCGGLNLQVGRYYLVATRQTGSVLRLTRGDKSIVDISSDYIQSIPPKPASRLWQTQFADYLAGKPLPKAFNPLPVMYPVYAFPPDPETEW